jgi:hypothetical protein
VPRDVWQTMKTVSLTSETELAAGVQTPTQGRDHLHGSRHTSGVCGCAASRTRLLLRLSCPQTASIGAAVCVGPAATVCCQATVRNLRTAPVHCFPAGRVLTHAVTAHGRRRIVCTCVCQHLPSLLSYRDYTGGRTATRRTDIS